MWSDWRPEVVRGDLDKLAAAGLQLLRVFPLWPDFQPITLLRGGGGAPREIRNGEVLFPDAAAGRAGVSPEAIERFAEFASMAQAAGLKLLVGLVTGWMSGRFFAPPALEGLNHITDPMSIMWQVRFVKYFVERFKNCSAVAAWDLGNECNGLGPVAEREEAWAWTSAIVNAIRSVDPDRAIVSGMHGLSPSRSAKWVIQDQGELTDVLTTHPYPVFTPHCDVDPVNSMRGALHATAESRLYADVGGKPCFAEEIGTLGPMFASEGVAADYLRMALFSLWAHDCRGLLWWCAHDQAHLEHAPYDWGAVERELGLLRVGGSAKPVMKAMTAFRRFLDGLPFDELPERLVEGVCLVTEGQDQWAAAFATFVLAKQAGFDLRFQHAEQPIQESQLYLLPCVSGLAPISRHSWMELLERAKAGATLYVSTADGVFSPFNEAAGVEIQSRGRRAGPVRASLSGPQGESRLELDAPFKTNLGLIRAEALASEDDGNPVFTCAEYGKGRFYFLSVPMEMHLAETPGVFEGEGLSSYATIYRMVASDAVEARVVRGKPPTVGVTEHPVDEQSRIVVLVNYASRDIRAELALADGWRPAEAIYGEAPSQAANGAVCPVGGNDAAVFYIRKG